MKFTIISILYNILMLFHQANSFNILAIISQPLKSHYMAFHNLFRELSLKGHTVTVINNFTSENTEKLRFIDLQLDIKIQFMTLEETENMNPTWLHITNYLRHLEKMVPAVESDCETLFTNGNVQAHLAEGSKYDVIFVEQFISDCALVFAAVHFDAPIIGITSHVMLPWSYPRMGIPLNLAADPYYFSNAGPNPSLYSKIENVLMNYYMKTFGKWHLHGNLYKVFEKHMPNVSFDVEQLAQDKMKMLFVYQHHSITGARLATPQVLDIGGVHIRKPKAITKDLEDFLSTAEHGAIFVSFGSNLMLSTMSHRMLNTFLEAFKRIPQKVLMKWENDTFPTGHDNVFPRKWFPQLDVLCHPKVIAFVSHGGMLSLSESVHCGKPMVSVPFFGDQFANGAAIRAAGFGKTLMLASITAENLSNAIKVVTSSEMRQRAKHISKLWHDRPQTAMESAIYWTEYVGRYKTAPPSLPSQNCTWFESQLLDVVSVLSLVLILLLGILYMVSKFIVYLLRSTIRFFISSKKIKSH